MIEAIIVVLGVVLDQLSKHWVSANLYGQTVNIIPGVLSYSYVENTGAAFGMLNSSTILLSIASILLAVSLSYVLIRYYKQLSKLTKMSLALIVAGGIGNMIDRVFNGFVVDFIQADFMRFAVFNIADICITFGTILLIMAMLFIEIKKPDLLKTDKPKKASGEES